MTSSKDSPQWLTAVTIRVKQIKLQKTNYPALIPKSDANSSVVAAVSKARELGWIV
jgi:hypothetical protein